jgi:hypothetical protein
MPRPLVALTPATATAAPPTPMEVSAPELPRLGATPSSRTGAGTRPRTPIPGLLLDRGHYTKFDAPDAVLQTVPFDINNRGVIVGKFTTADGVDHGFRRDALGRFTIDVPGAAATQLNKINDRGQIVGYTAAPTAADPFAGARGFLLARGVDGPFTPISVPGAPDTFAFGLNDRGQITGTYNNPNPTHRAQPIRTAPMGRMA